MAEVGGNRLSVVGAELRKLLTLNSIRITLAISVLAPIGFAAVSAGSVGEGIASHDPDLAPGTIPETVGLEWVVLAQIGVMVCGVLAGSTEYPHGQLKTSLLAVPGRVRLVLAKAVALSLLTGLAALIAIPGLSLVSQAVLGPLSVIQSGVPASLLWRWAGAVVFWVGMSLIGLALGLLMRQALIPLFGLIVVSQLSLVLVVATSWSKFLPTVSGVMLFDPDSIVAAIPQAALPGAMPWLVFLAWVFGLLGIAAFAFNRRDAGA